MVKKKAEKPQRVVTKRQLSRWQQQQKRQRIILGSGIFVIAAVIVIIGVGWYIGQYQPLRQTAIKVNDTEFDMKYYVETLKLYRRTQPAPNMELLADATVEKIEHDELIRQGASKIGISVTDTEVTRELQSSDLPNNEVGRDLARTRLLIIKLRDQYFEQQVPASAQQVHLMAMLLESEQQASEVKARLENGESFTELAGELSLDYLSKANQGDFGWHPKNILNDLLSPIIVEYAFNSEVGVLSQPIYDEEISKEVGYWLVRVLDRNEEEAHIQAMLLGSEEEAEEVRGRLEAGEDFATLAKEFSLLEGVEENEGEYEISPGMISPFIDDFAFDPKIELGTLSQPIRDETTITKGGYWLVKVVDKDEDRPIEDDDRELLKVRALDEWLSSLWDDPENEIDDSYLDAQKKAWAIEQAMRG
ncbi:MAG: peptidylprolyl isomerase [Dehalococcoidales bacterium]